MGTFICPADHKHGETSTCHTWHGCRCTPCAAAHTEYSFYWRHMNAAGRPLPYSDVDGRGTRRRLQALSALGWSASALGARLGSDQTVVSRWMLAEKVTRVTAEKIAALYDELSDTPAPAGTRTERLSRARTLAHARRKGFARPIEWDDIDHDAEPQRPVDSPDTIDVVAVHLVISEGTRVTLTRAERHEAVRQLHARHHSDGEIAMLLGVDVRTIFRDRQELELPAAVGADRQPIIQERAA
ncbi:hypothetical protein ACF044_10625 [Microbacterium sp. NPDC016588]